jgi:hypothetical protein
MRVDASPWRCTSSQQEPSWGRTFVDATAYRVPNRRETLPLIEEKGAFQRVLESRIGFHERPLIGLVQHPACMRPTAGRLGLADALGAIQRNRWGQLQQFVKLLIDGPSKV